ncbi:hypothetical protein BU14_0575s0011 [Porphyra umbilicalis]|uniref:Uncharacterized protein n=1 Tax=Porphyra umbilicalis TaxID=2786 RepID=A0A1X6NRJ3_PORUM|nr:hypothetical protein BU14_0575s0011 [Porphyra umbilicalis]|eukprot:OSX71224.1 hypothetical protein BU14_0575s0011 [Porphyra umbilicalis]
MAGRAHRPAAIVAAATDATAAAVSEYGQAAGGIVHRHPLSLVGAKARPRQRGFGRQRERPPAVLGVDLPTPRRHAEERVVEDPSQGGDNQQALPRRRERHGRPRQAAHVRLHARQGEHPQQPRRRRDRRKARAEGDGGGSLPRRQRQRPIRVGRPRRKRAEKYGRRVHCRRGGGKERAELPERPVRVPIVVGK